MSALAARVWVAAAWIGLAPATLEGSDFFEVRIRPLLVNHCYACHTHSAMGGLRLDSREALLKGGKSGPAIVPGNPEISLLIRAVRHVDEKLKMPLNGRRLTDEQIDDLAGWIASGAHWPAPAKSSGPVSDEFVAGPERRAFWSFQPLHKPVLPGRRDTGWAKSPIDYFILSRLEERGLKPVAFASKQDLIRRVTFDLTGLPPTPQEVDDFLSDGSPDAFARVVDRLLASPRYGERWARHWLDVARYAEDDVRGLSQESYPNAWRYRDWVIQAFNEDLPYNLFVKAQIAADLLAEGEREKLLPALGFMGLGPWYYDIAEPAQARADERNDRVDALTRGFFGLTVACARCHDHKYDPISMKDYYAVAGVFASTEYAEYPLADAQTVAAVKGHQKKIKRQEAAIQEFLKSQSKQVAEILARQTSRYLMAAGQVFHRKGVDVARVAQESSLDAETLGRWVEYLSRPGRDHPFLKDWDEARRRSTAASRVQEIARQFQEVVVSVLEEKKELDRENEFLVRQAGSRRDGEERLLPNAFETYEDYCGACGVALKPMPPERFALWKDLFSEQQADTRTGEKQPGVLLYNDEGLERFLSGLWRDHLATLRSELESLKKQAPLPFPFLHGIADSPTPRNLRVHLRGSPHNLGEEVPRRFLEVLSEGSPASFGSGSGRRDLAQAVAGHPLTARVIVNRIWSHHFGRGIVATPSNFGQLGERPSHPELLDFLAVYLIEHNYSLKALHRAILLSATYQLSTDSPERNVTVDPDNRLLWRANRRRLDVESLRDALLFVGGNLDTSLGGPSVELSDEFSRRAIYGRVSRFRLNPLLTLFDFPDPSVSSEGRNVTHVPLQRLFFMNSSFVGRQAARVGARLLREVSGGDRERIAQVYRLLYARAATPEEIQLGIDYIHEVQGETGSARAAWERYAQVLLSSNEFTFVN